MQKKLIGLIPARAGSLRVKKKNIRILAGHPLLAYTIASARESGIFDRLVCSTDSEEIAEVAKKYGAECPFLRPAELATSVSPDIDWIEYTLTQLKDRYDAFSILRPTSPFRTGAMIRRAWDIFVTAPEADSLRAVELCKQHPGKMWVLGEGPFMSPLLDQTHLPIPWHARQYQDLPKVYVQNSSLEIAWTRLVTENRSKEGTKILPFFTENMEGFTIDYEADWEIAELMVNKRTCVLPKVQVSV